MHVIEELGGGGEDALLWLHHRATREKEMKMVLKEMRVRVEIGPGFNDIGFVDEGLKDLGLFVDIYASNFLNQKANSLA